VQNDSVSLVKYYVASEETEACFVLPLREPVSHFARRNTRSTETEVGSSDDGNAHTGIDISANFGVGFLPLLGEPGR
jgi:hypothetical protein